MLMGEGGGVDGYEAEEAEGDKGESDYYVATT